MEEVFRLKFNIYLDYLDAKRRVSSDLASMGISRNLFDFGDSESSIISHCSHFYLRKLLEGTDSSRALALDNDTYRYFTNQDHDRLRFTVIPNVSLYAERRREALDYYAKRVSAPRSPPATFASNDSPRHIIRELLKYPKSCVGERHDHRAAKAILISDMASIRAADATILVEHLFEEQEAQLDRYLQTERGNHAIAPEISRYVENSDRSYALGHHGLVGLLKTAREHGVRVRGIETPFSLDAGAFGALSPLSGVEPEGKDATFSIFDRLLMMNYNAERVSGEVERSGGRSILLCGGAHVTDFLHPQSRREIPGLASSFGCPVISVEDRALTFSQKDANGQSKSPAILIDSDAVEPRTSFVGGLTARRIGHTAARQPAESTRSWSARAYALAESIFRMIP